MTQSTEKCTEHTYDVRSEPITRYSKCLYCGAYADVPEIRVNELHPERTRDFANNLAHHIGVGLRFTETGVFAFNHTSGDFDIPA